MPSNPFAVSRESSASVATQTTLRYISSAQFVALAATYTIFFASMTLVEERTHASVQMGLMIFAFTLPGYIVGMLAGVLLDRYDRRRALIVGNLLCLFIAAGFAAATRWLDDLSLSLIAIYSSNFLLSAMLQFTASARDSLIPRAVAPKQLMAANSILQIVMLVAQGIGTVLLAPLLIRWGGAPAAGLAVLPMFALATWLYAQLPYRIGEVRGASGQRTLVSLLEDLRAGWNFIASHAPVRRAIGCFMFVSALILVIATLMPGLMTRVWGVPVAYMTVLALPGGIGFAVGVWMIGRWGDRHKKEAWMTFGILTLGVGLILLPALNTLHGFYVILFLLVSFGTGAGFAMVIIPARTLVQERAPDEVRGRVISAQLFLSNAASTLPLPLMGKLADVFGLRRVISLLALIALSVGVVRTRHAHA
jgi:DHA3 family macrolide efflux protein-like MFS transporter